MCPYINMGVVFPSCKIHPYVNCVRQWGERILFESFQISSGYRSWCHGISGFGHHFVVAGTLGLDLTRQASTLCSRHETILDEKTLIERTYLVFDYYQFTSLNNTRQFYSPGNTAMPEEQGWRSGESTHLPPMWLGFDSWTRRHMWVEFVVGSRPCSERFLSGYSGFPLSWKPTFLNFDSIWKVSPISFLH